MISYAVAQRTREMGVREGVKLCAIGAAIGVLGALALGQVAASLLYGVTPYDLPTYASVLFAIVFTVTLACWPPAMRALRVDPTIALRSE